MHSRRDVRKTAKQSEADVASPEQEVSKPKRKKKAPKLQASEKDDSVCPVCLENWTTFGDHRIFSLKCGHLFCLGCIKHSFVERNYFCPTCKNKAFRTHIRHIYARKLSRVDTNEYEKVKRELKEATAKNAELQTELMTRTSAACSLKEMVDSYRIKFSHYLTKMPVEEVVTVPKTMTLCKYQSVEITSEPGCRVFDHNIKYNSIVTSAKSSNYLFGNYGIYKIDLPTHAISQFLPLHTKSLRDVRFHPEDTRLATVSIDKQIRIVDTLCNNIVMTKKYNSPLWSCCWSRSSSHMLYVGNRRGVVSKFDLRKMTTPLKVVKGPTDRSPVVSLVSLEPGHAVNEGLLICQLCSVWAYESVDQNYLLISDEAPFASMSYDISTNHVLLAGRPTDTEQFSQQVICRFEKRLCRSCTVVRSVTGDPLDNYLSRSCFVRHESQLYFAAYQEYCKSLSVWDTEIGRKMCSMPASDIIFDICNFNLGNDHFVAALTEKNIDFYKLT